MKFTSGLTAASAVIAAVFLVTTGATTSALADTKKSRKSTTSVEAPHTKVEVDETVRVKAPYTKVKVGKRRVKVRAPYVNLDIKW